MGYIPEDAKWYIAELVMEFQIEGDSRNVVHVNIVLIRADSPEEAFEKAEQLGREDEDTYKNPDNHTVTVTYRGIRALNVIHDELEHGAELMYEEKIGICEDKLQAMLTPKSELAIFRPWQPKDSSVPDYSSKEVMEEVRRMMGYS
jgi:hypothetical protein